MKSTTTKADSFFRLTFNVYIAVDNRERARARDKIQRRPISLEEKHKNFIPAVRKRGNASGHQGENEQQRKKKMNRNTKCVTREFLEVSRCSPAKQRPRNVQKKCAARAKLFFAN